MAINPHSFLFLLMALIACVFAVAVVLSSNIVRMAFYLVISLAAVAALFFLAGADFVGALQLMIYVGGTLVLLIFGVMLTARGPFVSMQTGGGHWVLTALVVASLLFVLVPTALSVGRWAAPADATAATAAEDRVYQPTSAPLGLGLIAVRVDQLEQENDALRPGMAAYLLPFEIVSVHLVVVLVGAAYLARTRRRKRTEAMAASQGNAASLER